MSLQGNALGRAIRCVLAGAGLVALAACGGGGGSNVRDDFPDIPPPSPPPDTTPPGPQPTIDAHLELTNTFAAHEAGYTGRGVRIGLLDSGIRRDHPAINNRVDHSYIYLDPRSNDVTRDDVVGHGTTVAQLAGGAAVGRWPGGVAPGARFVSARIISDKPPSDDGSGRGNEVTDGSWLGMVHADLIASGAKISNNSWGGLYWNGDQVTRTFVDAMRPFVLDWGGLVVFSTGNSGFANPSDTAALPALNSEAAPLERGWLAVGAIDTLNPTQLADYSNACGRAMDFCLVAPGYVAFTGLDDTPGNPTYWVGRGTSYAAPLVSGAAALVWEAFPYFDNDLVRQTLLGTATDLGAAGVDPVFGHGLLDVGQAVRGPARLDWGQVTANFSRGLGVSTWGNDISGAGGITKNGTGHLDLTGVNSYRGETRVNNGVLSSLHDLPGNTRVGANGLLLLDGISIGGGLANDGTAMFYGANAAGTAHAIAGDYTQSATGTLAFDIGSRVAVQGRASLAGDALVTGITPGYVRSARETFLSAAGGISGRFANLLAGEGVFLQASLGYDANTAWLDIGRLDVTATAQAMGLGVAAVGSAVRIEQAFQAIDRGGFADGGVGGEAGGVSGFITGAAAIQRTPDAAAAGHSLASLSGELHAADTAFAMMAMEDGRHALESRLDTLDGRSAGAWATRLGGEQMAGSARLDTHGWLLGQDLRLAPQLTVGAAFGQTDGQARNTLRRDREHNRQYEGQLYAAWDLGDSYLLGRAAVGRMERAMQREVVLGADRFGVDADYANRYTSVGLQLGHRFRLGAATLVPYVGAQSLRLERDAFSEHGAAGFGLSSHASRLDATQALAGMRLSHGWQAGPVAVDLQGRLEWQRTLSQSGQFIDARFTGLDVWSPITGAGLGEQATVFGLGVGARLPAGRLGFDLDARRESGRTWAGAFASWTVGF